MIDFAANSVVIGFTFWIWYLALYRLFFWEPRAPLTRGTNITTKQLK